MAYRKSRLKRVEEARAVRTTFFYVVLTIGAVFLLVTLGIPTISRLSSYVLELSGQEIQDQNDGSPPPPPPRLNSLPVSTNSSNLKVTGTTRPGYTVYIFFNDERTEVLANAQGEFTALFELSTGENIVYAQVLDNRGRISTETEKWVVAFDNKPPELTINSPEDGKQFFTSRQKLVTIEGATEPGAKVYVNDRVVVVRTDGSWQHTTTLEPGENNYKIVSRDQAGNETEATLTLHYAD